ncbi:MAG: hypothetical protein AAB673_02280 [Patescibacteria group bacterium]
MFIVIDGADGTGKSTVLNTWEDFLKQEGYSLFSLKNFWKENNAHPDEAEWEKSDVIISAEPTYAPMGRIIREELIRESDVAYPPEAIAQAFSLDRLILYHKVILPALKAKKIIIQDRSVTTSLVYQAVQSAALTLDRLAGLPGNQLALEHAPDYLIVLELPVEKAMERLQGRDTKKDNAIFENPEIIKKNMRAFHNPDFCRRLEQKGVQIIYFDTSDKIDIMREKALNLFKKITKL